MPDSDECLAYATHLRSEHRRLHKLVNDVIRAVSGRIVSDGLVASPAPTDTQGEGVYIQLKMRLDQLRDNLAHHFHEEEEGGCIEEAISRCPSFSDLANELEDQHSVLLNALDQIISKSVNRDAGDASIEAVEKDFHRFAKDLRDHEILENRIIQQAFGCGLDMEDEDEVLGPIPAKGHVHE